MNNTAFTVICLLIPFIGTTLGALAVFLLGREVHHGVRKFLLGFASGVMIAASVWSLIIPALEMAEEQKIRVIWLPAVAGFLGGTLFLMLTDSAISRFDRQMKCRNCTEHTPGRSAKLFFAVTLHNIPEGMAVGVALAGYLSGSSAVGLAGTAALAFGIAVQNFPEGAIVSLPLAADGHSRKKAFGYAFLSGAVEPLFGVMALLITALISPALPYFLSFAAGAMIYVVVEELIPEAQEGKCSRAASAGAALGFAVMMLLDVALG